LFSTAISRESEDLLQPSDRDEQPPGTGEGGRAETADKAQRRLPESENVVQENLGEKWEILLLWGHLSCPVQRPNREAPAFPNLQPFLSPSFLLIVLRATTHPKPVGLFALDSMGESH